jgi:beta-mannosidase
MPVHVSLNGDDWLFKGFYGEDWRWRDAHGPGTRDRRDWRAGSVPGSVAHDLWRHGEIADPYFERNTLPAEWVAARTWLYRKTFQAPEEWRGRRVQLCFSGVDYEAEFFLNGESLGRHAGMYTPAIFEVGERLAYGQENLLAVVIEPAPHEQPQVGRTSRVHTHKSRMPYWWDFCPRLVHQGIWDEVALNITGAVRLEDVWVRPELSAGLEHADVSVTSALSAAAPALVDLEVALLDGAQVVAATGERRQLEPGTTSVTAVLPVERPRLWWPNGLGDQPLHQARVRVVAEGGELLDERGVHFGVRRLRFVPNATPDASARPYTLEVNNRRAYIQGWNWVPLDVLYGVERPEKLERLLTLARRANVNMLRVWGGGLIEKEAFYDLCDRLGLLVWQEFSLSSSGIDNRPPDAPDYLALLTREAEQIVPRRRNHPSLALWCGGNELQSGPEQPADDGHPALAALKAVVESLDPGRYWLPTSPSGRVFSNSLDNIARDPNALHDVHGPWEHQGLTNQFALYNHGSALLHSEFGVEGITNLGTLNATIAPEHQWPIDLDNPYWFHLGAWWVKAPRWREVFGALPDVPAAVRALQFLQADGLRYAVEAGRRRQWRCSGTLPWQFNEPYPMAACTSAVDYYARPKPAYYAVAQAYEPVHVSARFPAQAWAGRSAFTAEIFVSHAGEQAVDGASLAVRLVGAGGTVHASQTRTLALGANGTLAAAELEYPLAGLTEDIFFLDLQLSLAGSTLSRNRYVFTRRADFATLLAQPTTHLDVQPPGSGGTGPLTVSNRGGHTAFFVWLEDARPPGAPGGAYLSDNHFCLFPGESRTVTVEWHNVPPAERRLAVRGWNTEPEA